MNQEPQPPQSLVDSLARARQVLICTHVEPDGDCIASSVALASALRRAGKEVHQFNPGPFDRSEIQTYRNEFLPSVPAYLRTPVEGRLAVVLDCSQPERIGDLAAEIQALSTIVIDHHPVSQPMGDSTWVVPYAPAAAWLVQIVIESLGNGLTRDEARLLLFGFSTDTGFFRHIHEQQSPSFLGVSRLVAAGASPRDAHAHMYGNKTLESRKLIATLLDRMQSHYGGRLLITWELQSDTLKVGKENRDSDSFYQLASSIADCEALVLIREESPGRCTGSLRSRDSVDVRPVAQKYGGGGHKNASGFLAEIDCMELVGRVVEDFAPAFSEPDNRASG